MNRKKRLLREQAELVDERKTLLELLDSEDRGLSDAESTRESEITARLAETDAELEVFERQDARLRQMQTQDIPRSRDLEPLSEAERASGNDSNDVLAPPSGFPSFGEHLRAIARAGMDGFRPDPRLLVAADAASGMSEAVPSDGGYLVQQDRAMNIRESMFTSGQVLSRTQKQPIGANFNGIKLWGIDETSRVDGSRHGGVQGYWLDEAGTFTASKPKYSMLDLRLHKVGAVVYLTGELLEDTVALESHVMRVVPDELRFKTEDAIFRGTGVGQPAGILTADARVEVAAELGQAANTILWENIENMWVRMIASSRANAVWYINQDVEKQLMSMALVVGTGGVPVYLPAGGASVTPFATLMGRPVIPVEYCSTLGTVGDIIFADMSQYIMIDKGGVDQASSMHVRFVNDEMTFRFMFRVDGQSLWNSVKTPYQGANTLSPFVMLATRA